VAVGLKSVVIEGTGDVIVEGKDVGPGPWRVTGGTHLRIRHGSPPPRYISGARVLDSPKRIRVGRRVSVSISLPQLSVARLALREGSSQTLLGKPATFQPGVATLRARIPPVPSGTYGLDVVVTNGIDIVDTRARDVLVKGLAGTPSPTSVATTSPSASPSPSPTLAAAPASRSSREPWILVVAAAVAAIAAIGVPLAVLRSRRRRNS
jgi:hypothetical protein